jgi:crotonobetainyl-CoA:carnitine CoA-transferase CaiB-like acyl-CoA transferase
VVSPTPLAGTRVLDLTRFVAGSYVTMALSALGADVVKIEVPPVGDPYRRQGTVEIAGESSLFLSLNGGKRSLALDIRREEAREVIGRLVDRADFIVQNARPGSLDRHGLGWDAVHARNPRCVYASISGYGEKGPRSAAGGFDLVLQAESGVMSVTGSPDGQPIAIGAPLLDVGAGMSCLVGILAAHIERLDSGVGTHVGSSLLEFALAGFTTVAAAYLGGGIAPTASGGHSPLFAPYGSFRARDGWVVLAGAGSEHLWHALCATIGRPQLVDDARFADNASRVTHRDELVELIEEALATAPAPEWVERLERAGVPAGVITSVPDMLASEQVAALESVRSVPLDGEAYETVGFPFRFDGAATGPAFAAPHLGQHTNEVLAELAFDATEIKALEAQGVVVAATEIAV